VTPRTDVIQSVGRILRVKHENPIIVDIVDAHGIFQNQWAKRRRYYKSCNYHIAQTTSDTYRGMEENDRLSWKTVFVPKGAGATGLSSVVASGQDQDQEQDDDDALPISDRVCLIQLEEE
jgi:hypothetical protein